MFEIIQAVVTAGAALALLIFSGITLGGSAVGLAVSTPLFVIFSPILVPATIATTVLATGFTASGSFGAMAFTIISWLFKRYTGRDLPKIPGLPNPSGGKTEEEAQEEED